jgi:hypothetical protein
MASFNRGSPRIPNLGAVIKGGGGICKVRVALGSRAKSGGAQVIYYWAVRRDVILLLYAYPKNVRQISPRSRLHNWPK